MHTQHLTGWPAIRLCLLLAGFIHMAPGHAALNQLAVYDSGFKDNWGLSNWGNLAVADPSAQAPGRTGKAIEVRFSGQDNVWNAFGIGPADWNVPLAYYLNEIRTLEFDLYVEPDSVKTENLRFILEDSGNAKELPLVQFIPGWDGMTADQRFGHWFHVAINLRQLHPKIFQFRRFVLFNGGDASGVIPEPHFRMASVKLGWASDTTPPVVKLSSAATNLTGDELTLAFKTNEATTYRVEYGVGGFGSVVEDMKNWSKTHKVTLSDLTPGSTVQYRIVALDHRTDPNAAPNQGILEACYCLPATPTTPPTVSNLTVTGVEGHKVNLKWSTDRPASAEISYLKSGGATMQRSLSDFAKSRNLALDLLEPSTEYTGTLKVKDAFGNQASIPLSFKTKAASSVDVGVTLNGNLQKPISPYIYGTNQHHGAPQYTFDRLGGNRWTAYNWENNASNAGNDYFNQNDDHLPWIAGVPSGQYGVPGIAITQVLDQSFGVGSHTGAALITVPVLGHVAADSSPGGDVIDSGPNYLQTRFKQIELVKGAPFATTPDTLDAFVYTDEYVNWMKTVVKPARPGKQIFYSLDNEPDIWLSTHPRIEPHQESYDSLCQKNEAAAETIKEVDPEATVFGFVSYGWYGFTYLQGAPDGSGSDHTNKGDFTEYYLTRMKDAETRAGKRLVDVLDLHFYTSAETANGSPTGYDWDSLQSRWVSLNTPEVVAERVQSTRSLWDPAYMEHSWITRDGLPDGDKAIRLIPRIQAKIDAHYPGTKFAITEYNYGGGDHISGAVAQADVLGIYGQQGVFAANRWQMGEDERFIEAAFRMYRGFDGKDANFGDISLGSQSADVSKVAVYASLDSATPGRAVYVAINRSGKFLDVGLQGLLTQGLARVYRLAGNSATPAFVGEVPVTSAKLVLALPPMSISTIEVR